MPRPGIALGRLFVTICNQGTVYEASSHAVPSLIELLTEPSVEGKIDILGLLSCLATGASYLEVHSRGHSKTSEQLRSEPDSDVRLARGLSWVEATRDAVEAGTPVYLDLLTSDDWQIRLAAAYVLGTCTAKCKEVSGPLLDALDREQDERVRFGFVLCLGRVRAAGASERLVAIINSEPDSLAPIRWAAAVALMQIQREGTPREAIRLLASTFADPDPFNEFLETTPWHPLMPRDSVQQACEVLI